MEKLEVVRGRVAPLDRKDVDTDQIIPARHLKKIVRTGLGEHAFEALREDPGFFANVSGFERAPLLLAGPNFGCGSSREHAVWAIRDMGFRVVLAPNFADIFRNNCARFGVLTVELGESLAEEMMAAASADGGLELEVDLRNTEIRWVGGDRSDDFTVDPFVRHCLLEGLDAIDLTLAKEGSIAAYEARRPSYLPRTIQSEE